MSSKKQRSEPGRGSHVLGRRGTVDEYFAVKWAPEGGCHIWHGCLNDGGYGLFRAAPGRTVKAHRWAYERWVGPIPEGLTVDHTCGRRKCVNPAHLEPVTRDENIRRYVEGRRHAAS